MSGGEGLGGAAARGAAVSMGGQAVRLLVQVLSMVVLARLLSPADYGLLAMVMAVLGVAEVVRDFGLSQAAVQAPTLGRETQSNLFWVNSGIGLALTLVSIVASPLLALLYGDDRLTALGQFVSLTFFLNGIGTQFRASLNRSMAFGRLAIVDNAGPVVGLGVAVFVALSGGTYWALGWQQVAAAFASLLAALALSGWLPGRIRRASGGMRSLFAFAGPLVGVQLITYFSRNVDSIVVGVRFGPAALGIYDRAFQLLTMPLNQVNAPAARLALPILSRLRDRRSEFDRFLLHGQTVMVAALVPVFGLAATVAEPLVQLALGDDWLASAPLFRILAVAGIAQIVSYATYWTFLAMGATRSNLFYTLSTRPLIIAAVLVGSIFGVEGVAMAYAMANLMLWPVGLIWIRRFLGAPAGGMFATGLRSIGVAAVSSAVAWIALEVWGGDETLLRLGVGMAAYGAANLLMILLWRAYRKDVRSVIATARRAFRR